MTQSDTDDHDVEIDDTDVGGNDALLYYARKNDEDDGNALQDNTDVNTTVQRR